MADADTFPYDILVIGTGQLGSSLVAALRQAGLRGWIGGVEPSPTYREQVQALHLFDTVYADIPSACPPPASAKPRLIVLASPLHSMTMVFTQLQPLASHNIITDVGSAKGWVIAEQQRLAPHLRFVPGHPIAGTEKAGPSAVDASLYKGRIHWLCPLPHNHVEELKTVETLWRLAGADVQTMPYPLHDQLYARTSHSAQALSWILAHALQQQSLTHCPDPALYRTLRIGASDATMWQDIFLYNRDCLCSALRDIEQQLAGLADGHTPEDIMDAAMNWRQHARKISTPVTHEWLSDTAAEAFSAILSPAITLAIAYCLAVQQWQRESHASLIPYLGAGFMGITRPATASKRWRSSLNPRIAAELARQMAAWRQAIEQQNTAWLQQHILQAKENHRQNCRQFGFEPPPPSSFRA